MAEDDTWRPISIVGGDGTQDAAGVVEMPTMTEKHPCCLCRSWEKDTRRLVDHFIANGLVPNPDGSFETPIAKDFKGRVSLKIWPKQWGYCRRDCMPTQDDATCPNWSQVRTASEMASRIR